MPDPKLISYDDWIKGTSRMLHVRSKELKAVDTALKNYNPAAPQPQQHHTAVSKAFEAAIDLTTASLVLSLMMG